VQETSQEGKRLSQNRQSFKEAQEIQQKKIKRSATGKTLSINDVNMHSFGQTGYINTLTNPGTLCNPTFISSTSN
jgi:cellobiose-specific phosphotransferase system component IIA